MAAKLRLGGMALANGVLVHGPRHWACAVRTRDGSLRLASGRKPIRAVDVESEALRGPARLAEVLALIPTLRRALPEATLPFQRPRVAVAMAASALGVRALRSTRLRPALQEGLSAVLALGPAALAVRGSALAAYHGAEHMSIGRYEDARRPASRVHERCGSHMVGPLLVTSAVGGALARLAPSPMRPLARLAAAFGAVTASTELFAWMVRNERHPLARALARPGRELQDRFVTAEPSLEQLEVANAALAECLRLESEDGDGGPGPSEEAPPT